MNFNIITGSGKPGKKTIPLKTLQTLVVEGSMKVEVRYCKENKAEISADDNLIDLIVVEQVGDTVTIGTKPNSSFSTKLPMRVTLFVLESLKEINLEGSGSLNVTDNTCISIATVLLSGSGSIFVDVVNTVDLNVTLTGTGTIAFRTGRVENINILLSGTGKIVTEMLFSQHAIIKVTGSGTAKVNATKTVQSTITGSGNIKIIGDAKSVGDKITGSGKLHYN